MSLKETVFPRRRRLALALIAFLLTLSCGLAAAISYRARHVRTTCASATWLPVTGTWRGNWHGVEAVVVNIVVSNESYAGTAKFYRLAKTGHGFEADGATDYLPLQDLKYDGRTLSFHVSNNEGPDRRHIEADFEMLLLSQHQAELRRVGGIPANSPKDKQTVIGMTHDE